jgi:hypothetical protein
METCSLYHLSEVGSWFIPLHPRDGHFTDTAEAVDFDHTVVRLTQCFTLQGDCEKAGLG